MPFAKNGGVKKGQSKCSFLVFTRDGHVGVQNNGRRDVT